MDECDRATQEYPPIALAIGASVHVYENGGEWCVWLNVEDSTFTGLCLSVQPDHGAALREAQAVLSQALDALRGLIE